MKNIIKILIISTIVFLIVPLSTKVYAAGTMLFSPSPINITLGSTSTINIIGNSGGTSVDSIDVFFYFSSSYLSTQASSFVPLSGWSIANNVPNISTTGGITYISFNMFKTGNMSAISSGTILASFTVTGTAETPSAQAISYHTYSKYYYQGVENIPAYTKVKYKK